MIDRTEARACAMKLIYEWEMGGDGGAETRLGLLNIDPEDREAEYIERMLAGVIENIDEIDALISSHSSGWALERIARVDLAILRLCVYELMLNEVAYPVALNEAVELAKKYSGDKSPTYVNGVLGTLSRDMNS